MAEVVQIKSMKPRHEAILNYILSHPATPMGEVAQKFGLTQSWLSVIMNSPAFLELLKERQQDVFEGQVLGIADKLNGLAHIALDKLIDRTMIEHDIDKVEKVAKTTLNALGYGKPTTQVNIQNNSLHNEVNMNQASKEALIEARQTMKQLKGRTIDALPEPATTPDAGGCTPSVSTPEAIPAHSEQEGPTET